MKPQQSEAKSIFLNAVEIDSLAQRQVYIEAACAGDEALRCEVKELLRHCQQKGSFLESPAPALVATIDEAPRVDATSLAEQPGTVIGPYKLLEQIGEGGFGVVYMAEQQQPVRRRVALKIIKPGMDTKQVVARFEAERQALALMDHPHIARVLDVGASDSGRPYFVMELVRGIPITRFCDDNRLTLPERLELFVAVCQAVQHAHQKGIIHRDLKPSNVLVTLNDGTPLVKVIDFGIAKALGQQRLTDKTLFTGFAQMIGTPLYMSPEQAEMSGQDADTRTDIYALGVLLYELLTGTTPFDKERLKEASYEEIRRIIREEEPAKPSTRISTLGQAATMVSANRKSDPRRLGQLFRGELDWIVMKALEKDRNRRYETASSFAADVQRYLGDEPVQACPPSAVYRFRKFARRNKTALMTASAVAFAVLLAVAGLAASTVLVWRANQELHQNLYYQRIALAEREWSANNLSRVEQLLDACPPNLRGWEWHYLKRLRLEGIPPLRHSAALFSAALSPDDRWIASGGQDGAVTIWDATTGQKRLAYPAHEGFVNSVAFSADGRLLATASWDKTVKVWGFDPARAAGLLPLIHTLRHQDAVHSSVAFSPDSQRLASGDDQMMRVWDMATGREIFSLAGHTGGVGCVAYSADGQYLATASWDKTVKIWDAKTGREKRTLRGHSIPVSCVAFSRDGKQLASAAGDAFTRTDGEVKVWDAQTGMEIMNLGGHVAWVASVAFSPDGRRLASSGLDSNVTLWDLTTGQEALTLRGHTGNVRSLVFSSDGNRIISAGHDRFVRVWNATPLEGEARQEIATLRGHHGGVRSVAFSPDGRQLASVGSDATVRLWDFGRASAGARDALIQSLSAHKDLMPTVAFSADGRLLAPRGELKLTVWDATIRKELPFPNGTSPGAFSPDGRYIAAAVPLVGTVFPAKVWDAATAQEIYTLEGHTWVITALAFSPDPGFARLASASADGTVRIWDMTTGQPVITLPHADMLMAVAFNRDGRYLASAGRDRTVKIWDTKTWQPLHDLRDPTGSVESMAFHPKDDQVLAWGSTDSSVKIWHGATKETRTLRGHTSWVESVAFSPDGKWIASGSLDGTVKLWRMPPLPKAPDQAAGASSD